MIRHKRSANVLAVPALALTLALDWEPVASLATFFLLIGAALTGALQPTPGRVRGTR